jgi:Helix-turn-helix domain
MATKAERRQATANRLAAMQHPVRRAVLQLLIERGVSSPVEMGRTLREKTENVSHHVKRLVELDCAELVDTRQVRGAVKHYYRATDRHLIDTEEWDELDPLVREGLLVDFLQPTVDDFTVSVRAGILGADENFHLTRTPLHSMDQQGLKEALAIHERAFREVMDVQTRCGERLRESGEKPIAVSSSQGCFEVPPWREHSA